MKLKNLTLPVFVWVSLFLAKALLIDVLFFSISGFLKYSILNNIKIVLERIVDTIMSFKCIMKSAQSKKYIYKYIYTLMS